MTIPPACCRTIGGERHDDGNRFGRPPRGMHGWICSGNNDVNLELH